MKIQLSKIKLWVLGLMLTMLAISCKRLDVYEKNIAIPNYQWKSDYKPNFQFIISDTSEPYQIYVVLRHTDAYAFNNVWLNVGMQSPGDTLRQQKLEVILGNDAVGWEGTGMNDIWEVRKAITNGPIRLKKTGVYNFSIAQIMRQNPLTEMLSVGVRVERVKGLK